MAVDNKKIAEDVLAAVGGASNVTNATHCMTRLRLNLKDQSIPNDDEVKKIKGVLGAQWSGGQYQVIIGQNVPKVYDAAIALGVKGEGSIDENLDGGTKEPLTLKTAGKKTLNYLSKTMVMTIPIIMAPPCSVPLPCFAATACSVSGLPIPTSITSSTTGFTTPAIISFLFIWVGLPQSSLAAASRSA